MNNWGNAIQVQVLEAHCFFPIEAGAIAEVHTSCIHQLLPFLSRWVDRGVSVEVLNVVEWLHIVPEVHVAKDAGQERSDKESQSCKRVPHWVSITLFGSVCKKRCHNDEQEAQAYNEPRPGWMLIVK